VASFFNLLIHLIGKKKLNENKFYQEILFFYHLDHNKLIYKLSKNLNYISVTLIIYFMVIDWDKI